MILFPCHQNRTLVTPMWCMFHIISDVYLQSRLGLRCRWSMCSTCFVRGAAQAL